MTILDVVYDEMSQAHEDTNFYVLGRIEHHGIVIA